MSHSVGLQTCPQGTEHHSESTASGMDSPAVGVTSAGAMRPFVKILWPLVISPPVV